MSRAAAMAAYEATLASHARGSLAEEARQAVLRLKPPGDRRDPPK